MMTLGKPEIVMSWAGKEQNVYRRKVLYQEVWNFPVTEVAKKYAVSDAMIHKVCKSMDIPTPPAGYWARRRAGKETEIPPLPPSSCQDMKFGLRTKKQGSEGGTTGIDNAAVPFWRMYQGEGYRSEEELKQKETKRKRYNAEVTRTRILINQAEDYDIACKIRALVAAEEQKGTVNAQWLEWAKAKADWFDPTVKAIDSILGRRNHGLNAEQKVLKER